MTKFLYPPRPEKAIPPDLINYYQSKGWIAQIKKNGTCCVIYVNEKGIPTFWNRHKELQKAWVAPEFIVDYFKQFPDSFIVAELLHNKSPNVKNTLYIFDILRYKGKDLLGTTYSERMHLINSEFPAGKNIILAECYTENFEELFKSLSEDIDEGLVFKNPKARLKPAFKKGSNADWQVKVRKKSKNYGF